MSPFDTDPSTCRRCGVDVVLRAGDLCARCDNRAELAHTTTHDLAAGLRVNDTLDALLAHVDRADDASEPADPAREMELIEALGAAVTLQEVQVWRLRRLVVERLAMVRAAAKAADLLAAPSDTRQPLSDQAASIGGQS